MQKYGTNPELDKMVDSEDLEVRKKVAEQGYGWDILINDKEKEVRDACRRHKNFFSIYGR